MAFDTSYIESGDWSHVDNGNQLVAAIAERGGPFFDTFPRTLTIGVNTFEESASRLSWIEDMVAWLGTNCVTFVQSHNVDGTARAATYHDLQGAIEMWTPAKLYQSVSGGVSDAGFRRATEWPTDPDDYEDEKFSYGAPQVGDIAGPWIFKDLFAAFARLIWKLGTVVAASKENGFGYGWSPSSLPAAQLLAQTTWPSSGGGGTPEFEASSMTAYDPMFGEYTASLQRGRSKGSLSGLLEVDKVVQWIIKPVKYYNWDNNGDFTDAYQDKYKVWESQNAGAGATATSDNYATSTAATGTRPNWPTSGSASGWLGSAAAIVQYAFNYI